MGQILLINKMIELERMLDFEEEKRRNHRFDPYVNYLAAPQDCRNTNKTINNLLLRNLVKSLDWIASTLIFTSRFYSK